MLMKDKNKDLNYVVKCFREFLTINKSVLNHPYCLNITDKILNSKDGDLIEWIDEMYDYVFSPDYPKFEGRDNTVLEKFKTLIIYIRNLKHEKLMQKLANTSKSKDNDVKLEDVNPIEQ